MNAINNDTVAFARNSLRPIQSLPDWIVRLRIGIGPFPIQPMHFGQLVEMRAAQIQQHCGFPSIAAALHGLVMVASASALALNGSESQE